MTVNFTLADLARTLREVAAERPEFVYRNVDDPSSNRCLYFHSDGEPGCIFGVALHRLGVAREEFGESMNISYYLAQWFGGTEFDEAYYPFNNVQRSQDNGYTWGEAVRALDLYYPL